MSARLDLHDIGTHRGPLSAIADLRGWRRILAAVLAGAAAAAALPPVSAAPLLFIAFPALLVIIGGATRPASAFLSGWWFGFGFFVAGLYWLAWPLTLDLVRFGWMIPFAVFGISGVLAAFPAVAAALAYRAKGAARILFFAAAWTATEWLRGYVFTGFPWNLIATAWTEFEPMVQPAALAGAYGLGLLTVAVAAAPVLLVEPGLRLGERVAGVAVAGALLAGFALWGADRIAAADARPVEGVRLRLVQGNIKQELKWDQSRRAATFAHYIALTRGAGFERITHVVWPETAIDYRFVTDYEPVRIEGERRQQLVAAIPKAGALILGAIRDADRDWFNSVHVVSPAGAVLATYDKHHLVPFGEYVPLRGVLRRFGIEQIAHGVGDYNAGPGPRTLPVPGAPPVSPLVCYEAIFPGNVAGSTRPGWLLNVTNDAWFGYTSGPYQHFAAARLRAVEEGLPLVRAANTGITAVVDSYGRVIGRLRLQTTGVLDADLPRTTPEPTLYARVGDRMPLLVILLVLAVGCGIDLRQIARRTTNPMQGPSEK